MADIEPGYIIQGKYRLMRRLSRGGMGSVWLAEHLQLEAPVAVKFMRPAIVEQPNARSRFEREAKSAAQIRSPYVVHIYDHGIDGDTPFIVMEYLEGSDLRIYLKGGRMLPPHEAARICEEICKGLHRAHLLGIVHRDLKPGNIFLSEPDEGMVKILDFGIAKETGAHRRVKGEITTTGQLLGSPHYMSPEQARGRAVDGRSDLWSLAVIMFRAMTGHRPFDGSDIGDLIVRICVDEIPSAAALRPDLGPAVDAFFQRAFCRDPDGRYQYAKDFAGAFKLALKESVSLPSADDSGSWDLRASQQSLPRVDVQEDEVPTQMTPSGTLASQVSSSARFENVNLGPVPTDSSVRIYGDTFATAAARTSRSRMIIGGAIALLILGGIGAAFIFGGSETSLTAPAGSGALEQPTSEPQPSSTASATSDSAASPQISATAAGSAPTASAEPSARKKPVARRRTKRHDPPPPKPAPSPTGGKKPPPPPNVLGY